MTLNQYDVIFPALASTSISSPHRVLMIDRANNELWLIPISRKAGEKEESIFYCRRRLNIDPLCRLNIDPGLDAVVG